MLSRYFVLALFFLSMFAQADTDPATMINDYQILKYQTPDGAIVAAAGVDWSRYTEVQLERGTVEFREGWADDQLKLNKSIIRESDQELIKTKMSELLEEVLSLALADEEGYTLSGKSGADVLRFTPSIRKLDIYAPAYAKDRVGDVLTDSQGDMVLVLDISDSVSGKLLATAVQAQKDPEKGYLVSTNRSTNKIAFRGMMERWTTWLFELFDQVRDGKPDL